MKSILFSLFSFPANFVSIGTQLFAGKALGTDGRKRCHSSTDARQAGDGNKGLLYFLNSLNSWSDQVNNYKGVIRANWEAAAARVPEGYELNILFNDTQVQQEFERHPVPGLNSIEWSPDHHNHLHFILKKTNVPGTTS